MNNPDQSSTADLPSWRPGPTRDRIQAFLDAAAEIPPRARVAVFDNDGTLWCERPTYTQFEFTVWAAEQRAATDPTFATPPLLDQLDGVSALPADGSVTAAEVVRAMNLAHQGHTPEEFATSVQEFAAQFKNASTGRSLLQSRYQPMLELIAALRAREFDVFVVTGGGIELVRSVAWEFYGVSEERVVGSMVDYSYDDDAAELRRGIDLVGPPDEGVEKVHRIQQLIGRHPVFAAGNSAGDRELLDHALASPYPAMSLLVDHDDADREFSYQSIAASFDDGEDIVAVGRASGWTIASIKDDWSQVFSD